MEVGEDCVDESGARVAGVLLTHPSESVIPSGETSLPLPSVQVRYWLLEQEYPVVAWHCIQHRIPVPLPGKAHVVGAMREKELVLSWTVCKCPLFSLIFRLFVSEPTFEVKVWIKLPRKFSYVNPAFWDNSASNGGWNIFPYQLLVAWRSLPRSTKSAWGTARIRTPDLGSSQSEAPFPIIMIKSLVPKSFSSTWTISSDGKVMNKPRFSSEMVLETE